MGVECSLRRASMSICSVLNGKIVPKPTSFVSTVFRLIGQFIPVRMRHTAFEDLTRLWQSEGSMPTPTLRGRLVRSLVALKSAPTDQDKNALARLRRKSPSSGHQ